MRRVLILVVLTLFARADGLDAVQVRVETTPPGARLYLDVSGSSPAGSYLGRSGEWFWLDLTEARRVSTLRIRCYKEGFREEILTIPSGFFESERVWPPGRPVRLTPNTSSEWMRLHIFPLLAVASLLGFLGIGLARRARLKNLHRIRQEYLANWPVGEDPLVLARVANWRLLERLGQGAHGVAYRAVADQQIPHGQEVVLKLFRPGYEAQGHHEARVAGRLVHPGLVPMLDYGNFQGRFFVVYELVRGTSLANLSGKEAAACLPGLLEVVCYAHEFGVVHGDIRPQNVLVDERGRPRLIDFCAGQTSAAPSYVAPELLHGGRPTRAGDQYSLGVVAWEVLTGQHPFQADDLVEMLRRRHQPLPELPGKPQLGRVLHRMLADSPQDRYRDINEAAAALRAAMERA